MTQPNPEHPEPGAVNVMTADATALTIYVAPDVARLAHEAGRAILAVYERGEGAATEKADGSPLTEADTAAHHVLARGLHALDPNVPQLSEEGATVPFTTRRTWTRYWLIDPLDGTKEFLKRNGEFTVNVALVEVQGGIGVPVLGVVHVPVQGTTYVGVPGRGATRQEADGAGTPLHTAGPNAGAPVRIIASRSHGSPATEAFIHGIERATGPADRTTAGSSLKLCRVAEGAAHHYPRVAPTMEWDTAAAHAVVTAAGGVVWAYGTRTPLAYGKHDLHNPPFLATHGPDADLPPEYDAYQEESA